MSSVLRADLLARAEAARVELLAVIEGLSDDQMAAPSLDDWSVRDQLAHIAAWDELRYYEIMRVVRGQPTIYHDLRDDYEVKDINRAFTYFRRNLTRDEMLRELGFCRGRVMELVETISEEKVAEAAQGRVRIGRIAEHDLDHAAQIRDWRKREGI